MEDKIKNAEPMEYNPKGALCCHVGCEEKADYQINGPDGYEDYTHMCKGHVEEYVSDDDEVFTIKH